MREAQMPGMSQPGQFKNLEDIFEIPSGIVKSEKKFPDFGPLGIEEPTSGSIEGLMEVSIGTPFLPPSNQSRPRTPANQLMNSSYPVTPQHSLPRPLNCFTQSSPIRHDSIDLDEHFQSSLNMKRGLSYQELVQTKRDPAQNDGLASAPSTVPMRSCATFDANPIPSSDLLDLSALELGFPNYHAGYNSSNYSPTQTSPAMSSRRSSVDLPPVALFGEIPSLPQFALSDNPSAPSSPSKTRASSPRKKPQPIPEEMTVHTGVTSEQVEAFIQGPDPETSKFFCLFEGCRMGPFGRKENIRAHVQTHLGDRKYVCTVCENRFVRPNDLKRHAIIHQEVKEFTCKCGAAFGRQDALRRHRIRKPFCVDGDPTLELMRREEKKRGRPRKIAPTETTERRERKENIRKQVMAKKRTESTAPSIASTHKSGRSCSPEDQLEPAGAEFSPGNMSLTPPVSPGAKEATIFTSQLLGQQNGGTSPSPPPTRGSTTSAFLHDGMDFGQDSPFTTDPFGPCDPFSPSDSQTKSAGSSPPELDLSSSPPAPHFLELNSPVDDDFARFIGASSNNTVFSDNCFETNDFMDQILKDSRNPSGAPFDNFADLFLSDGI
ncbi:hypothetical protein MMC10_001268 [Thelotrema lepadinum]|nr:hypothetical protein [Thelotrema lepadinum]